MRQTKKGEKVTISVVGAGNRADVYLHQLQKYYQNDFIVNGVFDPDEKRQKFFQEKYKVKPEQCYNGIDDFIKLDRISDVVIIATLDDMHFIPAMHALDKGYDIILEKPIAMNLEETVLIGAEAEKKPNQLVAVCHVLRHSPFFRTIKEVIDSKELGEVVNIQHNENVGYFHYAHSYVRGNWRNTNISSPFIVAKACHDFDILLYLLGKSSIRLSSMGDLTFFHKGNFDEETMTKRDTDNPSFDSNPYSAVNIYSGDLIKSVVFNKDSEEKFKKELETSQYGKNVFASDNNVADTQVTIMEFEDKKFATFNLSAFTNLNHRSIKVMCTYGEIRGSEATGEVQIWPFGKAPRTVIPKKLDSGHGGADAGFMINFMETYLNGKEFDSTISKSIESHVMAYAAEESRINKGQMIETKEYYQAILDKARKEYKEWR